MAEPSVAITVRFFAGAADAAGRRHLNLDLTPPVDLGEVLDAVTACSPEQLAALLDRCNFLVGSCLTRDRSTPVMHQVDILPPFAGG